MLEKSANRDNSQVCLRTIEPWRKNKQLVDSAVQYGCSKLMIEKLKPEQDRAVSSFVEGNDVFICLPTGNSYVIVMK